MLKVFDRGVLAALPTLPVGVEVVLHIDAAAEHVVVRDLELRQKLGLGELIP
jgi:hypothetical protein